MKEIVILAHNIRSTHNIGAIFRTAEGFGIKKIILSGYSPYPSISNDTRLPHIREKITEQIHKTALDAEKLVPFEYNENLNLQYWKNNNYKIIALEQSDDSIDIRKYTAPDKIALLLGEEVHGIPQETLSEVDDIIEIPMYGKKESFNVSIAAGIAMYKLALE